MNKVGIKINIGFVIVILGILILCTGYTYEKTKTINNYYKVYLDGEVLGIINSKEGLEEYINNEQQVLKDKYDVDKVYAPNGLEIVPYKTYDNDIKSIENIYNKINGLAPFTINGYVIEINREERVLSDKESTEDFEKQTKLYVLHKEDFVNSVNRVVNTFIDGEQYKLYLDGEQLEIENTGEILEDVYIEDEILIKKDFISVKEEIFIEEEELTKKLLFGTTEKQKTYVVKKGDNITDVSYDNQLNTDEFLIANPEFNSVDNLLYEGQEVIIGLINPEISVISKTFLVSEAVRKYETEFVDDDSLYVGKTKTSVDGVNGLDKVSQKVKSRNGDIINVDNIATEVLTPATNAVVLKGTKKYPSATNYGIVAVEGIWAWPTEPNYYITSYYTWRWGRFHAGIDIAGTGKRSNIYAANSGVVVERQYSGSRGNAIVVDHGNGYFTEYLHLDWNGYAVELGDAVEIGQVIGYMGTTGRSTGVHLHFGVWKGGAPYKPGAKHINPLSLY